MRKRDISYILAYTVDWGVKEFNNYSEAVQSAYEFHRNCKEGPAMISYDKNHDVVTERYIENNKLHNEFGPAFITYLYGKPNEEYYLYGNKFTKDEWKQLMIKKIFEII